jgi:hypothetical protein
MRSCVATSEPRGNPGVGSPINRAVIQMDDAPICEMSWHAAELTDGSAPFPGMPKKGAAMLLRLATYRIAIILTVIAGVFCGGRAFADEIVLNKNFPIRNPKGGSNLSPPNVEATNECAVAVYVDAFVPHATVTVVLNGASVIGGPVAPEFGFAAIPLTPALHTGDKITATQTVNGVKSAPSTPMVVGAMPATLNAPVVGDAIFAAVGSLRSPGSPRA